MLGRKEVARPVFMTEKNWALGANGAKVVEVSREAANLASAASNLLVEREDLLWITSEAPQHVTLKIADPHPPLRFVGWHVWHDYLSNPKTVEIASGESADDMTAALVCQAVPGAGTQVWRLPSPIPPNHLFVRVKILETFDAGPTYMNNVVLFANDPGTRFRGARSAEAVVAKRKEGSSPRISEILKDLDEDIRALRPIKTVSANKNMLLYVPQEPVVVFSNQNDENDTETPSPTLQDPTNRQGSNGMNRTPQYDNTREKLGSVATGHGRTPLDGNSALDTSQRFNDRLCALEQSVASLTQSMNHQREDLTMIKRLLLQQASERRRELEQKITIDQLSSVKNQLQSRSHENARKVSRHQVSVDFPEDALRSFVESVVGPKLHKHTKRTESQTLAKLDDFLKDIVAEITQAVDDRVRYHLHNAAASNTVMLTDMLPPKSTNRGVDSVHTASSLLRKDGNSGHIDYRTTHPAATTTIPPRPVASAPAGASPPPMSGLGGGRQNRDVGNVPVSIIRDMSMEGDLSFFRNAGTSPQ